MKYYLETNAIIALANSLDDQKLKETSSTSAFSILELVSGLNENNFSRKRSPLKKLIESKIPIEWVMPEEKLWSCFSIVSFEEERIEKLKLISELLCKHDTYNSFVKELKKIETYSDFESFIEFDKRWRESFINATIDGNKRITEILKEEYKELETLKNLEKNLDLNTSLTIYSFAILLSKNYEFDIDETLNSYNGKNKIFLNAFSFYSIGKMSKKELPAKNDIFDLSHLLYLNDQNKVIVTDDKIFKSSITETPDLKVIGNTDFLNEIKV